MRRGAALVALVLAASGCGGGKPATDAATIVPGNARAYATLHPRRDTPVARALAHTPAGADRLASLRAQGPGWLDSVLPGAGPEVDVALLPAGAIVLTRPSDAKAYAKRLDAHGLVHARIAGWTVVARAPAALAAVRHRRTPLATAPWFRAARRTIAPSGDPAVFAQRGGGRWTAATASARGKAFRQAVHESGVPAPASAPSALAAQAPDDALYVLELADPSAAPKLPNVLGLDVRGLLRTVGGPLALWLTPGTPLPGATIVARPANLRGRERAVGRLLVQQGEGRNAPVRSGALESLDLGPVTVYWGVVGGELVVSDEADAPGRPGHIVRDLLREAAVPGRVARLSYLDPPHALPVVQAFAALANTELSQAFLANAVPLEAELSWTSRGSTALYQRAR